MIDTQVERALQKRLDIFIFRTYFPNGTNGRILVGEIPICKSIELPWKDNQRKVSCIPEGTYPVVIYNSPKHGECLLLEGVPGRSMVEVHEANWAIKQLEGCIAPVTTLESPGVGWRSGDATNKLEGLVFPFIRAGGKAFVTIAKDKSIA